LEKERRNNLRRVIHECRKLLEEEIAKRLAYYGTMADGQFLDLAKLPHLTDKEWEIRHRLEQAIEKEALGKLTKSEAVKRYSHHVGFTYLNRFAALRAMEVRGLLKKETIIRRNKYGGRSLRERDIAESNPQLTPEQVLKVSLTQAFQEVGEEIKVLFDMNNEYSLVFPETRACLELIALLTEDVTEDDWKQDDVIGWIYQYFNSEARKEFRKARRKPRADDIPVINQFYTPDWIVKVLVDNALGRLWLEMHPDSKIKDFCNYFVPLKDKNYEREVKHIRDIKVMDPACGSGHFLVYAFDLLYQMYLENEPEIPPSEIPALILENNLFGIDIDLRSVQLAALSLYLKAKTYSRSLKIRGINLICADARIADSERRLGFLKGFQDDPALQHIFARLFEELEFTYEIGSLLKVRVPFELLFQERVSENGKQARLSLPITGQAELRIKGLAGQAKFAFKKSQSSESPLTLVIPKERTIEEMLDALRSFERESIKAQDMGRLLFATETEKSVGLLSLLSQKYDVIVMNPPYGDMPGKAKAYLKTHYPKTHFDYYTAFIEQASDLAQDGGFVGSLTGRTFMFLTRLQWVREVLLNKKMPLRLVLDLGFGVLDEATARWAAFVATKAASENKQHTIFVRLTEYTNEEKRKAAWLEAVNAVKQGIQQSIVYEVVLEDLRKVPGMPLSFWVPQNLRDLFIKHPPLDKETAKKITEPKIADLKQGLATGDDDQFVRRFWEVEPDSIGRSRRWLPYVKDGDKFYIKMHQVVNWENDGQTYHNRTTQFCCLITGNRYDYMYKPGLTWRDIVRTTWLEVSPFPENSIFSVKSSALFPKKPEDKFTLLALCNSSLFAYLFTVLDPLQHDRGVGYMSKLPIAQKALDSSILGLSAEESYDILRELDTGDEVSTIFIKPWILQTLHGFTLSETPVTRHPFSKQFKRSSWPILNEARKITGSPEMPLKELAKRSFNRLQLLGKRLEEIQEQVDGEVFDLYEISRDDSDLIEHEVHLIQGGVETKNTQNQVYDWAQIIDQTRRLLSYYIKRVIESDEDGIVPIDEMFPDNLIGKIRKLIAEDFGKDNVYRIEQESREILGKTLKDWVAQEYFDFHVSLYENRPIFWQITSYQHGSSRNPPGVFSCFVHYHKATHDTIPKIRAFYLERVKEALTREKEHLLRVLEAARATGDGLRINRLSKVYENTQSRIDELDRFETALLAVYNPRKDKKGIPKKAKWVDRAIAEVRDNGWKPIIDYGVRVNIEPLKEARLLHPAADRVK
jgi:hypothetical protein